MLQQIGFGLIGLFFAFLLKLLLPVALLQPAWQLQLANALRTTAIFPLLGGVLLLLAQLLRSQSRSLAGQVLWVRRLAFLAALGFLLLIPLQTSAGIKLLGAGNSGELRALRQVKAVAEEIRVANSEAAMKLAISRLPGAPAEIQGAFTKPIDVVRSVVLDQLQPQIERADNRLAELRKLRLQGGLLGWITDGLAALALAVCFAAIGQLQSEGSSLLLHVLNLPGLIRFCLAELLGKGRRSREPVDAAWFDSLHDGDDAKPANLSDAEWAIIVSLRTGKTSAASSKARSGDNQGGAGSST
ncbi:MAG: hypothetical protein NTY67_08040 [Cyanobacteria bacterium]|nr:hypothetical protein [Cyanobacteriota bacterium]